MTPYNSNAYVESGQWGPANQGKIASKLIVSFCRQAGVYFDEITGGSDETTRYVPRSVQIDLETGVCNAVSGLLVERLKRSLKI